MITNLGAERLLASSPGFSPIQRTPINNPRHEVTTPIKIADLFFQGKKKPQKADYPVIILGGGLAGMTAAYKAHQHGLKALVLESSERLGGNAKTGYTQFVNGKRLSFPVGASVLAVANDEQRQFFKELGVDVSNPQYKIHNDIAFFDGAWVSINPDENSPETHQKAPWTKEFTDGVQNFIQILRTILRPRDGKPQFPLHEAPDEIFKWDKLDLKTFLDAFPEKVRKFFAVNLRSDISNDMESVSALAGIIDQGADQGERCLFPGGNYFVIQKMINKIKADAKASQMDSSVTFQTHSPVVKIEEGKNFATVHYKGKNGAIKTVTGSHILLGIPSHRVPDVMPSLPSETAKFLKSIQRGAYAMLNIFLEEAPVQSNTYYKFPDAKWVADVVLSNEHQNPDLKPGSKAKSVITCYIPIPDSLKKEVPNQPELIKQVIEEMSVGFPWLKEKMKGTRLTYYPEAMSAPAPGQMEKIKSFDTQLSPHVQLIHSDLSGVFAARGAIDEANRGIQAVLESEKILAASK